MANPYEGTTSTKKSIIEQNIKRAQRGHKEGKERAKHKKTHRGKKKRA